MTYSCSQRRVQYNFWSYALYLVYPFSDVEVETIGWGGSQYFPDWWRELLKSPLTLQTVRPKALTALSIVVSEPVHLCCTLWVQFLLAHPNLEFELLDTSISGLQFPSSYWTCCAKSSSLWDAACFRSSSSRRYLFEISCSKCELEVDALLREGIFVSGCS